MSNKDRSKPDDKNRKQAALFQEENARRRGSSRAEDYRSTNLRDSQMMDRLMDAMEKGQDVGQYGRLTFVMVARHFVEEDEMLKLLEKQPGMEEKEARALVSQVQQRGYNPPRRERILEWQERQDFQICPNPEDPNSCNVYRDLQFPDEIYEQIDDYWEEKAEAGDEQ